MDEVDKAVSEQLADIRQILTEMEKRQEAAAAEQQRIFRRLQQAAPPAYYQARDFRKKILRIGD